MSLQKKFAENSSLRGKTHSPPPRIIWSAPEGRLGVALACRAVGNEGFPSKLKINF